MRNVSRNTSVRESNNNSLNKDSLKMAEKCDSCGVCPTGTNSKSHRIPVVPHHNDIINNQELLEKGERAIAFNQNLINKKTTFHWNKYQSEQ